MPKKVYDVIPPKVAHKTQKKINEFLADGQKKPAVRRAAPAARRPAKKPANLNFIKPALIGLGIIACLCIIYLIFKLPKAEIKIWPRVETLSFKQAITADTAAQSINNEKAVIPAEYFENVETITEDFPATGNASNEGKATGTITVYNKISPPDSMTLKAGTHFLSDSGKYFVSTEKVIIPAGKKSGAKVTPGSIGVKVEAAEGGEAYNIGASNFSIPKLSGTAYYYSIYGASTKAMSGGYSGKVKKVTDDDLQAAKDTLIKKATQAAKDALKKKIPEGYVVMDDSILTDTSSAGSETKAGTVVENFTYKAGVKASCLAFKKSDLEKFAKDYIVSQLQEGKKALDQSFKMDYAVTKSDVSGGKASVTLDFSAGVYKDVDKNSLAVSLPGKDSDQIKQSVAGAAPDASRMDVKLWPFWVTKAPKNQKAIKVDLIFQ